MDLKSTEAVRGSVAISRRSFNSDWRVDNRFSPFSAVVGFSPLASLSLGFVRRRLAGAGSRCRACTCSQCHVYDAFNLQLFHRFLRGKFLSLTEE